MNQSGVPAATTEPIIEPAEVPTIRFASIGSQPISVASGVEAAREPGAALDATCAKDESYPHRG